MVTNQIALAGDQRFAIKNPAIKERKLEFQCSGADNHKESPGLRSISTHSTHIDGRIIFTTGATNRMNSQFWPTTFLIVSSLLFQTAQAAESYTVSSGSTITINEHGLCRRVNNPHPSQSIWVPTKSSAEWNSFIASPGIGTVSNCLSCTLPWGGSITHGSSTTAYSSALPAGPCSGVSQSRTCTDGVLSGSFTNQSCTNGCTSTPWGNVASGYSNTAYSAASVACGGNCSSVAQTRTCTNGTLSGSFSITSCTVNSCGGTWVASNNCAPQSPVAGTCASLSAAVGGACGTIGSYCSGGYGPFVCNGGISQLLLYLRCQ